MLLQVDLLLITNPFVIKITFSVMILQDRVSIFDCGIKHGRGDALVKGNQLEWQKSRGMSILHYQHTWDKAKYNRKTREKQDKRRAFISLLFRVEMHALDDTMRRDGKGDCACLTLFHRLTIISNNNNDTRRRGGLNRLPIEIPTPSAVLYVYRVMKEEETDYGCAYKGEKY